MIFLEKSGEERVKDCRVQSARREGVGAACGVLEGAGACCRQLESTQISVSVGAQAGSRLPELKYVVSTQLYPGGGGRRVS